MEFQDKFCMQNNCFLETFYTPYEQQGDFPDDIDGLIGIGTKMSEEDSWILSAARSGLVQRALIGLSLNKTGGEITFGGYDPENV